MASSTTSSQTLQHWLDTSTVRSKKECTVYHKPESLASNWLRNDYNNMDTAKARQHPALETQRTTNFLHLRCWRLQDNIPGERECTAPTGHCATVLQMLVQLVRQTILWLHHQVGLQWQKVHLLMPNYVNKALARFKHTPPRKWQDQPYPMSSPHLGQRSNIHK